MSILLIRIISSLLLSWLLFLLIMAGLGNLTARILRLQLDRWIQRCWLGIASAVALLQIEHFFLPIRGPWLGSFLVLSAIGWILWFMKKRTGERVRWPLFSWILFALCLLWLADRGIGAPNNFDTGLYHQTGIRWCIEYAVVPGLGNLNSRIGFNNSSFLLYAMASWGPWIGHSGSVICGSLMALLLFQAIQGISALLRPNATAIAAHVFDAAMLIPILAIARFESAVASPTNDMPPNILGLATASMAFALLGARSVDDRRRGSQVILLAILLATAVCMKLSMLFYAGFLGLVVLAHLLVTSRGSLRSGLLFRITLPACCLLGPWMLNGVLLSGFPLYPSSLLSVPVPWRVPFEQAREEQEGITSSARWQEWDHPRVHQKGEKWFLLWVRSYLTDARETMYLPTAICLILLPLALRPSQLRRPQLLMLPPLGIALFFWFLLAPNLRFAVYLFWSLAGAMLAITFSTEQGEIVRRGVAIGCIACLCVVVFLDPTVTIARRQHVNPLTALERFAYVAPDPTSGFNPMPTVEMINTTTRSGLHIWVPAQGVQCWDAPLPCSPRLYPNLRLRRDGDLSSGFVVDPIATSASAIVPPQAPASVTRHGDGGG